MLYKSDLIFTTNLLSNGLGVYTSKETPNRESPVYFILM